MKPAQRELTQLSAREIAAGIRSKKFSAREVTAATLERIERINPQLNALVDCDQDGARIAADAVDRRVAAGDSLPFAGVPITIKDNIWVGGRRVAQGSKLFENFIAPRDAWCVARLKMLGAIVVGITNCSEFACKLVTNNLLHGATRNPWNPNVATGGSSGGAASAVSARLGALALGTDAGGSVRRPAAHCGVVGMKPSTGLVPQLHGFGDPNFGVSVIGQFAREVEDVALMLEALVAFEPTDPWSVPLGGQIHMLRTVRRAPPLSLRIAWSRRLGRNLLVDADVMSALAEMVDKLRAEGYTIEEDDPSWPDQMDLAPNLPLQQGGLAMLFGNDANTRPELIDPDLLAQIKLGQQRSGVEIINAFALREQIQIRVAEFFQRYDLLLCPTAPVTAWSNDDPYPREIEGQSAEPRSHAAFTPLFNSAGVPACSVPVALVRGLPIGLQVVGPRHEDARVLQFSRLVEDLVDVRFDPPI